MNNTEAIEILDQAALDLLIAKTALPMANKKYTIVTERLEAVYVALTALRKQAEREKGCEYCNSEAFKSCGAKTIFGLPKVYLGEPDKNSRFKFCPMCGKRLEGKQDG